MSGTGGDDSINGTSGNDYVDGQDGDDTIRTGAGNDTVLGGEGADDIETGTGNDTVIGEGGNDTLHGNEGNDNVSGGAGNDSLDGGHGDDTIDGGSGNDSIEGDEGNDTIFGGTGDDTITGDDPGESGNDVIHGDEGNDRIDGAAGDDTIYGGDDQDSIDGGDGNDEIYGDAGDDTIAGGAGNDDMYGNDGADVFVIRDADTANGSQNDTIQDFNVSEDALAFEMAEISSFQDMMDRAAADGMDTVFTFNDGSTLRVRWVQPNEFSSANFYDTSAPVCLAAGTPIATARGDVVIEALRVGDHVLTRDHGLQPLRAKTMQTMVFRTRHDRARPVMIHANRLGPGHPRTDIVLSPQHRVLDCTGATERLIPAHRLTGRAGIRRMRGVRQVQYLNLLFDRHEVIYAAGLPVESLLLTSATVPLVARLGRPGLLDKARAPARPIAARPMAVA
ncbi:MAG: Hint domain-containing protein [Pseudomonadota bacterium]